MGRGGSIGQKVPNVHAKNKEPGIPKNRQIREMCVRHGAYTEKISDLVFWSKFKMFSFCQKIILALGKKSQVRSHNYLSLYM